MILREEVNNFLKDLKLGVGSTDFVSDYEEGCISKREDIIEELEVILNLPEDELRSTLSNHLNMYKSTSNGKDYLSEYEEGCLSVYEDAVEKLTEILI